jgi:hypothetical protein
MAAGFPDRVDRDRGASRAAERIERALAGEIARACTSTADIR